MIPPDAFLERVAKHVPAEVLAAYLLVNSFDLSHTWRWIFFALFIAAAPIVDQWTADRVKARKLRPRGWIYALFAVIAFVAWALATSGATRQLIGIKLQPATGLMVLVSLLLGAVDDRVSGLLDRPAPGAREREARPPG